MSRSRDPGGKAERTQAPPSQVALSGEGQPDATTEEALAEPISADHGATQSSLDDLAEFFQEFLERRQRKQYQLSVIKEFFEDPLRFGVETSTLSTSSTEAELAERKRELTYRVELLQAVLEAAERELELLEQVEGQEEIGDDSP